MVHVPPLAAEHGRSFAGGVEACEEPEERIAVIGHLLLEVVEVSGDQDRPFAMAAPETDDLFEGIVEGKLIEGFGLGLGARVEVE